MTTNIDNLQTLSTAALRRGHSAAAATAARDAAPTAGAAEAAAGAVGAKEAGSRPILDFREIAAHYHSLTVDGNPELQAEAIHALTFISDKFVQDVEGRVANLMELLKSEDECSSAAAATAVRAIVNEGSDFRRNLLLGPMVRDIMGDDPELQRKATINISCIVDIKPDSPVHKVVETGIVPRLVDFLQRDEHPFLQSEATRALINITWYLEHTTIVVDAGANPTLVRLVPSPNEIVANDAALILGRIAACSSHQRDLVLQNGAVPPLVALALLPPQDSNLELRRTALVALTKVCGGDPRPDFGLILPALPAFVQVINREGEDDEVVANAWMGVCGLTYKATDGNIQEVIDAGVCPRLIEHMHHRSHDVQERAIVAAANILLGSNQQVQVLLDLELLPALHGFLASPHAHVQEIAGIIVNRILSNGQERIQEVLESGIVPSIVKLLDASEFKVRKEAVWVMTTIATTGTVNQVQALVVAGCVPALCGVLNVGVAEREHEVVRAALKGLLYIHLAGCKLPRGDDGAINLMTLRFTAEGRAKLHELQEHADKDIRLLACMITTNLGI